jgi:hypothetical protein
MKQKNAGNSNSVQEGHSELCTMSTAVRLTRTSLRTGAHRVFEEPADLL